MRTLEDIIPNEKTLDALYKLMLVNNHNNYILGEVLFIADPSKRSNSGMYVGDAIGLMKYDDKGGFVNITIEQNYNWEKIVCNDNNYEVLD